MTNSADLDQLAFSTVDTDKMCVAFSQSNRSLEIPAKFYCLPSEKGLLLKKRFASGVS